VLGVHRFVELAPGGVDLELREKRFHSEGAGLVGNDRDHVGAELLVPHELADYAHHGHRGGYRLLGALGELFVELGLGERHGLGLHPALWQDTAQLRPPLEQVANLF
jgi:hypothetical protein